MWCRNQSLGLGSYLGWPGPISICTAQCIRHSWPCVLSLPLCIPCRCNKCARRSWAMLNDATHGWTTAPCAMLLLLSLILVEATNWWLLHDIAAVQTELWRGVVSWPVFVNVVFWALTHANTPTPTQQHTHKSPHAQGHTHTSLLHSPNTLVAAHSCGLKETYVGVLQYEGVGDQFWCVWGKRGGGGTNRSTCAPETHPPPPLHTLLLGHVTSALASPHMHTLGGRWKGMGAA